MIIKDIVYGTNKIEEPIILELIKQPEIQRLKRITNYGVPKKYYFSEWPDFSRYEHSIGVMILLKKLGASTEEQIAGLLHDISTPALAHVADWVLGNGKTGDESYHDNLHKIVVDRSKISGILKKYGFDAREILNFDSFLLLERPTPKLCADRIDYSLRQFKYYKNPEIVEGCLNNLSVENGEIVFNDQISASQFANNYLECQVEHWGSEKVVKKYYNFSKILKYALDKNIICKEDFFQNDDTIINKLEKSNNKKIKELLIKLQKHENVDSKKEKVYKKFRHVDPAIKGGKVLSSIDKKFASKLKHYKELSSKGMEI